MRAKNKVQFQQGISIHGLWRCAAAKHSAKNSYSICAGQVVTTARVVAMINNQGHYINVIDVISKHH